MDIVIPYKKDHNNGLELRFALRSIEKYLTGYRDIYLIGDKPDWFTEAKFILDFTPIYSSLMPSGGMSLMSRINKSTSSFHISFNDVPLRKQFSIMQKLLSAYNSSVSQEFIYWHDDHFLLKPCSEIKPWYEGTLKEALGKASGSYHTAIQNTLDHFGNIKYFDIHTPCIFEKEKIQELNKLDWSKEYIIKSSYFNNSEGEEMQDCKIDRLLSKEAITERIKDRLFFSVGPNGFKKPMIEKLYELYPDKSRYEL